MLETKFKVAFLLVVLAAASLPIMGILRGTILTPYEQNHRDEPASGLPAAGVQLEQAVGEMMLLIPAGPFVRGTD